MKSLLPTPCVTRSERECGRKGAEVGERIVIREATDPPFRFEIHSGDDRKNLY